MMVIIDEMLMYTCIVHTTVLKLLRKNSSRNKRYRESAIACVSLIVYEFRQCGDERPSSTRVDAYKCMREIKSCISCISSFKVLLVPTYELCVCEPTNGKCLSVYICLYDSHLTRISTTTTTITTTITQESRKQSNCLYCKHRIELIKFNVRKTYDVKQHRIDAMAHSNFR